MAGAIFGSGTNYGKTKDTNRATALDRSVPAVENNPGRRTIIEYIEGWYNFHRRHEGPGIPSPNQFETPGRKAVRNPRLATLARNPACVLHGINQRELK